MNLPIGRIRRLASVAAAAVLGLLAACGGAASGGAAGGGVAAAASPIRHVFVIVLENKGYAQTFGAGSQAPYLSRTLVAQGALLTQYYGIGHNSLDNYLAMISGQAPNPQTQADCPVFSDWLGTATPDADGQVTGTGCVYPAAVKTVAGQLEAAGFAWRAYMEDMGNDLARDGRATCSHPAINAQDGTQKAAVGDQYATRHNPFMYFHSVIDDQANCDARVVPLSALDADLATAAATPHYVFISPNLCNDGHDDPTCVDSTTAGGLVAADRFLQTWVPKILASEAYRQDGLLIIAFDEASTSDASACCGQPTGPNTPQPGITGPGGGRVGAVLLSPRIRPGTVSDVPYNHYSLLRSVEDLFGLTHLGYAAQQGLAAFGGDIFGTR